MDDFGDFSSAFPVASVSGVGPNGNVSSRTVENAQERGFSNFSLPTVAKTGETGSVILPQPTDSIPPFEFTSFPSDSKGDGEMPNFADFGQFDMNIADITIPNPGTIDVSNGMLEIPPLPDDLQFISNSSMDTGIGENREMKQHLTSESELHYPSSSLGTTLPSESSSYQSFPQTSTLDSIHSSRESGVRIVPPSTAATTTAGPGPGPLRAEDNSGSSTAAQGDNRTTQCPPEQDDEFGDFESSFDRNGQSSDSVEVVTEARTLRESGNFATFDAFGTVQSTTEGGDWSSGFADFASMSSPQQQDSMPESQCKNGNYVGALGSVNNVEGFNAEFGSFGAFQQTTQTGTSDFKASGTNSEPTSTEGGDFETASEKRDAVSTNDSRNKTSLFSTSSSAPISNRLATNTDTGSKPQDNAEYGNFGAFASSSDTPGFSSFAKFEPSNTEASQTSGRKLKEEEDSEFGAFSSSGDDFGAFSGGGTIGTVSSSFSPTPTPPPPAMKINSVKACGGVLVVCFSASNGAINDPPLGSLGNHLKLTGTPATEGTESSVWQSVQRSVDFTVPLYKWNKSYMQQLYYGSLKIDPMLLPRPGALPVFASGLEPLAVPLGNQSAAEDLMESFGFESELEPQGEAANEGSSTFRRQVSDESAAPALLDLSLPPTPSSETQKDSFTLTTDLLGLDLNPHTCRTLTSIEELLINEKLVVNRSTWMDSKLLELDPREAEEREGLAASQQSSTNSAARPPTPASARRQPSLEQQLLQLGLDPIKTSFAVESEQKELSFSSQTLLGRLPDLSFMLSDVLVQTHYKK